ncbi:MAG: putative Ig domain-containing protein [Planctomycetota bacterium]
MQRSNAVLMALVTLTIAQLLTPATAVAQITITQADFFGLGDSYTEAALPASSACVTTVVLGAIGTTGNNNWDFTVYGGQTTRTVVQDYVATSTGGFGGATLFPTADFAQRSTDGPTVLGYLYLNNEVSGRRVHGFYNPAASGQPEGVFLTSALDYPTPITLGSQWTFNAQYNQLLDVLGTPIPTQNIVSTTAECDAWGTITLPNQGTVNCLRVMELQQTDVFADILGTGTFMFLDSITVRSYAWFAPGMDQVARIVSQGYTSVPTPGSPCPLGTPPIDFSTEVQDFRIQISNTGAATPPTIDPIADQLIDEINVPYSYQVVATGMPSPTYSLTAAPVGMTIDVTDGLIDWTPMATDLGTHMVTVQAQNGAGSVSESFAIDVVNGNDPPQNLATVFIASGGVVTLNWDPPQATTVLLGYEIRRSDTPGGPFVVAGSVAGSVTTFDDTAPTQGAGNYYTVVAGFTIGGGVVSDPSNEVFAYALLPNEVVVDNDDASAESGLLLSGLNSEMAASFDLPSVAEHTLTKVAIFVETYNSAPLTLKAYDDDAGVMPGSSLAQLTYLAPDIGPGWNILEVLPTFLQPVFVGGGSFFVGVVESGTDNAIGVDTGDFGSSWTKAPGGAWSFLSSGHLMIRPILATGVAPSGDYIRGDSNADGSYNIADAVHTLSALFSMGPQVCEAAMDSNNDNSVNIADAVFSLSALFGGGPPPAAPHPGCGVDGDVGSLTCAGFPPCP